MRKALATSSRRRTVRGSEMNEKLGILVIQHDPTIRTSLANGLTSDLTDVEAVGGAAEGLAAFDRGGHGIVIVDLGLSNIDGLELVRQVKDRRPDTQVIAITTQATIVAAFEALRCGAFSFVTKPIDVNLMRLEVQKAADHRQLVMENRYFFASQSGSRDDLAILGTSAAIQDLLRQIRHVAKTNAPVLIQGESGTGKERIARAIHRCSNQSEGPFVAVNAGGASERLLNILEQVNQASANARPAKTDGSTAANGVTLFLDGIADISPKRQLELLGALEERTCRQRSREFTESSLRVVSATNRDIFAIVQRGEFREDLLYRLNAIPLKISPLRERREDIPLLVDHFLKCSCERYEQPLKHITPNAMRALVLHDWPGNVRQLRNVVEGIVVTVRREVVRADDIPTHINTSQRFSRGKLATAVEEAERRVIAAVLSEAEYSRKETAQRLNISIRTLHYKMKRYGLH